MILTVMNVSPRIYNKENKPDIHPDFGEEFVRHKVRITFGNGKELEGVILEGRKYFYKLVTPDGRVYYINKAFVACLEFLE